MYLCGRKGWTRGVGSLCDFKKRYQLFRQTWVPNPSSITRQLCGLGGKPVPDVQNKGTSPHSTGCHEVKPPAWCLADREYVHKPHKHPHALSHTYTLTYTSTPHTACIDPMSFSHTHTSACLQQRQPPCHQQPQLPLGRRKGKRQALGPSRDMALSGWLP